MLEKKTVYLDNAATTRCDSEVAALICQMLTQRYGNPSSLHAMGYDAEKAVEQARRQVAQAVGCLPEEIFFTSGATEANNLALFGAARSYRRRGKGLVSSAAEHASVLASLSALEKEGFSCTCLTPGPKGRVTGQEVAQAVREDTLLVSLMLVNNETGAIQDIEEIARACREKNPQVLIHCDAVQALGKLPIRLKRLPVDLMTFSGHKIYAPKGIGALFVRKGIRLSPLLYGGEQQHGIRPGTENTAYIAGFGLACEKAQAALEERRMRVQQLHDQFLEGAIKIPGACINSPDQSTPYIMNISFEGLRSETMMHFLESRGVYVSSGSACTRGAKSHVLVSMDLAAQRVDSALRISFAADTCPEDVEVALSALREGVDSLARARR